MHIHVVDKHWRSIFSDNTEPVHYNLPSGIRSLSIEEGLLNCGYQLYRDASLRDSHFDVGYSWQTAYMSPNEGGSGASTPLYMDFCIVLLGWDALRSIASRAGIEMEPGRYSRRVTRGRERSDGGRRLVPTLIEAEHVHGQPRSLAMRSMHMPMPMSMLMRACACACA